MRIAHVIGTFPPHIGGMGRVVYDEATALAEQGHDVVVFTLSYRAKVYPRVSLPFTVERLRPLFSSGDAGAVPQLLFKLRGFDIVHLHYPFYGGAEWVRLARAFFGQRYVLTYHMDAAPTHVFRRVVRAVYDTLCAPFIVKGADKVLIVDEDHFEQTRLAGIVPLHKKIVLPNAVNTDIFSPEGGAIMEDNELMERLVGKRVLLFVGNLMPVKRLDWLLRALAAVPKAMLLVVGGGYSEKLYLELARELGLSERVLFLGLCNDELQLARYYRLAEAVVIPSQAESFSLVALEAMACGCPVIAAAVPGLRNRIRDGQEGFLFDPDSLQSLQNTISRLLALPALERQAMGRRGREKALHFGLKSHVEALEKIYTTVSSS